jgi:hypothetical protein
MALLSLLDREKSVAHPLEIGGQDYFLDLLFYHLHLRCYVVIDLKIEEFKPEFAGKMNFYLSAVDDLLRHADDAPSIGLILCKNRIVVEYALRDTGSRWEWIIEKAPVIEQFQNERQVEYIFDANTYQLWIDSDEEALRSASILARNSGITRVEMLNLEKDCVIIRKDPDEDGNWGDLIIKRGLKRRARKRVLKINKESQSVLENLISQSKCRYLFSQPRHPDRKLEPWILESEMGRLR